MIICVSPNHIQWGTVADAAAAIATFSAAGVAIWIAGREARQAKKQNTVDQAKRISAWPLGHTPRSMIIVSNMSNEPTYDVLISYGVAYGAGLPYQNGNESQIFVLRVPPGKYSTGAAPHPGGGMHTQLSLSISFRDSEGNYWRRDATGKLEQTPLHPYREMNVTEPISHWEQITPYETDMYA